ncbi:MAG: 3-hydroxyacyl-CoA dehydrogenase NAD-binding domain-containing protein [Actinomycetota bacterium]|nr:3-hydroxyacyl-CoA dehydrogenase NAD-binding domain-containing protein [Actinomycetota bacterium]
MIIVDRALEERAREGNPIRVAMVGAGFMGRGIALQILSAVPGMRLVAISNRTLDKAYEAYSQAGADDVEEVKDGGSLEKAISSGRYAVTSDPLALCDAESVDAIIEVTGAVEHAARVVVRAIERRKHVVLMNAELDGTIGPILKQRADEAGVVYTNADGDQPGVQLNLYRFVKGIGVRPALCGNIKGLHDPYRNPTTQEGFAKQWGQNPWMVTSFADGTKISFEQAIVANATGMRVARRGMYGPTVETGTRIEEVADRFPAGELLEGPGLVDYVVGAVPSPGVFVLGTHDHPTQQHYLNLYKLGEGPLYCFYCPYHLCHFEVPNTVARAVLFGDAAIAPAGGPCVDVVAGAKTDLAAGDELDGLGGYMTYGLAENSEVVQAERLLPIGLAQGCRLTRDVMKDDVLTYEDVDVPPGRVADQLRAEQDARLTGTPA